MREPHTKVAKVAEVDAPKWALDVLRSCIVHNLDVMFRVDHPAARAQLQAAIKRDTEAIALLRRYPNSIRPAPLRGVRRALRALRARSK